MISAPLLWLNVALLSNVPAIAAPAADSNPETTCLAPSPRTETLQGPIRDRLTAHRQILLQRHSNSGVPSTENPPTEVAELAELAEVADLYGTLAQLYHAHLIFAPAEACYRAALSLTPNDARAHYLLGYLYQQRGELHAAAASYRQALRRQPQLTVASLRLALILADQQHFDEARQLLLAAQHAPGLRSWVLFQLGRLALQQERYREAVAWLQQALTRQAENSTTGDATAMSTTTIHSGIHYPLAMALRALGQRDQARRHLQLNNGQPPAFPDPMVAQLERLKTLKSKQQQHYSQAIAAIKRQDYPTAIRAFAAGLATDHSQPQNPHARTSLARALFLNGEQPAAGDLLTQVVNDSQEPLALFLLGVWLEQQGNSAAAQRRYREVLALQPAHDGAQLLLADQLLRQQAYRDAAKHYQQAWQLVPDNHNARLRQILALAALGEAEPTLLTMLQQASHDFPQDPAIRYYLIRLLALAHDPTTRNTTTALSLASKLNQDFPGPNQAELLALTAAANGHFDDALRWLQAAIDTANAQAPGLLPALQQLQTRYRNHQPSDEPPFPLPIPLPPTDAKRLFRDYPSNTPY
jgi:tetratricopeptide (TPR) repeat protein